MELEQLGECEWLRISNIKIERTLAEGKDIDEVNCYLPCLECNGLNFKCDHYIYNNIISNRIKRSRDELEERFNLEDFKQSLMKCDVPEIQADMYKKQFQEFTNRVYNTINVRTYK